MASTPPKVRSSAPKVSTPTVPKPSTAAEKAAALQAKDAARAAASERFEKKLAASEGIAPPSLAKPAIQSAAVKEARRWAELERLKKQLGAVEKQRQHLSEQARGMAERVGLLQAQTSRPKGGGSSNGGSSAQPPPPPTPPARKPSRKVATPLETVTPGMSSPLPERARPGQLQKWYVQQSGDHGGPRAEEDEEWSMASEPGSTLDSTASAKLGLQLKAAGGALAGGITGGVGKLISGVSGLAKERSNGGAAGSNGSGKQLLPSDPAPASASEEAEAVVGEVGDGAPEAAAVKAELNWFLKLLGPQLCLGRAGGGGQRGGGRSASSPALLKGKGGGSSKKPGSPGGGVSAGGEAPREDNDKDSDALPPYREQLHGAGACYLTFSPASGGSFHIHWHEYFIEGAVRRYPPPATRHHTYSERLGARTAEEQIRPRSLLICHSRTTHACCLASPCSSRVASRPPAMPERSSSRSSCPRSRCRASSSRRSAARARWRAASAAPTRGRSTPAGRRSSGWPRRGRRRCCCCATSTRAPSPCATPTHTFLPTRPTSHSTPPRPPHARPTSNTTPHAHAYGPATRTSL